MSSFIRSGIVAVLVLAAGAASARAGDRVVVTGTGQVALAQPKIRFELRDVETGRALKARPDGLGELLGVPEPYAFLDTGASGFVFSKATAELYQLRRDGDGTWVEVGMSGEHPMEVSIPYTIALGPRGESVFEKKRLLVNHHVDEMTRLLGVLGARIDVVGMPAIRRLVVELRPQRVEDGFVTVEVLPRRGRPEADHWIALELEDFSHRRHPRNRGRPPALEDNPLVPAVGTFVGDQSVSASWLLDTGSAVTVISTAAAQTLGLPAEPAFELPMGGISGRTMKLPGHRVDRIEVKLDGGSTLVFDAAWVVVHDVRYTDRRGREQVLDGLLGMNLLLRSGTGFDGIGFEQTHEASCTSVIIDGPRSRLGIVLGPGRAP